jgi:hypothetical protein
VIRNPRSDQITSDQIYQTLHSGHCHAQPHLEANNQSFQPDLTRCMSLPAIHGSLTGTLRLPREESLGPPSSDRAYRHYSGRPTPVHLPVSAQSLLSPKPLCKPQIPRRWFTILPLTLDTERQLSNSTRRKPHRIHVQAQPHPSTTHSPWRIHLHSRSPAAASSWSCWVRPQSERYGVICTPAPCMELTVTAVFACYALCEQRLPGKQGAYDWRYVAFATSAAFSELT